MSFKRNVLLYLSVVFLLGTLPSGCITVTSSQAGFNSVTDELWYTEATCLGFLCGSTRIFYCPPSKGKGPSTCIRAKKMTLNSGETIPYERPITSASVHSGAQPSTSIGKAIRVKEDTAPTPELRALLEEREGIRREENRIQKVSRIRLGSWEAIRANQSIIETWIGRKVTASLKKSGESLTGQLFVLDMRNGTLVVKHEGKRIRHDMLDISRLSLLR